MSTNLADLRAHARLTYRYWIIYLILRLRELEQHLDPSEQAFLLPTRPMNELEELVKLGLWEGAMPPDVQPPPILILPDSESVRFEVVTTPHHATLIAQTATQQVDLLCSPIDYHPTLTESAARFNQMAPTLPREALLAARLWAACHGSRALMWRELASTLDASAPLPNRRRGKGLFRNPL